MSVGSESITTSSSTDESSFSTRARSGASISGLSLRTTSALICDPFVISSKVRAAPVATWAPQRRCISAREASEIGLWPGKRSAQAPMSRAPQPFASDGRTKSAFGASSPATVIVTFASAPTMARAAEAPKCGSAQTAEKPSPASFSTVTALSNAACISLESSARPADPSAPSTAVASAATTAASSPGLGCTQASAKSFSSPQSGLTTTTRASPLTLASLTRNPKTLWLESRSSATTRIVFEAAMRMPSAGSASDPKASRRAPAAARVTEDVLVSTLFVPTIARAILLSR